MAYEIRKGIPPPEKGLVDTLRQMERGDSIVIPSNRHIGVHACAKSIGAKVKTRSNKDGTVTVWRVDDPVAIDKNIFGDPTPVPKTDQAVSTVAASQLKSVTTGQSKITKAQGGYFVEDAYGPSIFVAELDDFGQPVVPAPKPAPKKDIFS